MVIRATVRGGSWLRSFVSSFESRCGVTRRNVMPPLNSMIILGRALSNCGLRLNAHAIGKVLI